MENTSSKVAILTVDSVTAADRTCLATVRGRYNFWDAEILGSVNSWNIITYF